MGLTHVQVTIRNPADRARSWEGAFLVDTGAIDSLVPRDRLEQIGLRPLGHRTYELADGRETAMDITVAELEFMGDVIGATIVIGGEGTEPLLGVTALESLGIEVDPTNQRLRKLPSIRLKAADMPPARARSAATAPFGSLPGAVEGGVP
jgi:clan AA aspartic protease